MMQSKPPKQKTCKTCKSLFMPVRPMAVVCSPLCGLQLARTKREKAEKVAKVADRRETREKLEKIKSKAKWAAEAQTVFNFWVRCRDHGNACISCGRHHQGQNHAGHYLSVGARPELRYEPLNVWLQCSVCNLHFSGNAVLFRQALLKKIGPEKLDWLEGPHPVRHYTIADLQEIKKTYAAKARELNRKNQE